MFVTRKNRGYNRDGEWQASGRFLAVFCGKDQSKLYGVVRRCALRQLGHWMIGRIRVGSQTLTVSGTYGEDGLPLDLDKVEESNRRFLAPVPPELVEAFWKGGGHNCAGTEAPAMHAWGLSLDGNRSA